jgi:hypothetical protein
MESDKYNEAKIADELRRIASGLCYHGNALYRAKDMPDILANQELRNAILRYLNGTQNSTDHIRLQEAAMLIAPKRKKN